MTRESVRSIPSHQFCAFGALVLAMVVIGVSLITVELPRAAAQPGPTSNFGDPLPGLNATQLQRFLDGKVGFETEETDLDGVGPVFNCRSCVECHGSPASGGGSEILSVRIGARVNGVFDPLLSVGGPTIQRLGSIGIGGFQFPGEVIPPEANIVSRRRSSALFGFGLVDAVPDAAYHAEAARQASETPETAGRPNLVRNLRTGNQAVGKFGWKAGRANVFDFSADAYKDEMGITVPGFFPDEDGRLIEEENPPQGDVALLLLNPVPSPNEPEDDDIHGFNDFISFLAPPPQLRLSHPARRGRELFQSIGCANCHRPSMQTGPNPIQALNQVTFHPYSDFLLHDMGKLGDGIEQGVANGREMRTAPLWGLRTVTVFLHDGRVKSVADAIKEHDGQARKSRDQFIKLPTADRQALLAFLNSI